MYSTGNNFFTKQMIYFVTLSDQISIEWHGVRTRDCTKKNNNTIFNNLKKEALNTVRQFTNSISSVLAIALMTTQCVRISVSFHITSL